MHLIRLIHLICLIHSICSIYLICLIHSRYSIHSIPLIRPTDTRHHSDVTRRSLNGHSTGTPRLDIWWNWWCTTLYLSKAKTYLGMTINQDIRDLLAWHDSLIIDDKNLHICGIWVIYGKIFNWSKLYILLTIDGLEIVFITSCIMQLCLGL